MKRIITLISLITVLAGCNSATKKINNGADTKNQASDATPKVTGIGGVFFYSDNPKATREWYTKNLGIQMTDWGSASFESRDLNHPEAVNSLQWKPFKTGSTYFAPSNKEFMINYRVQHMEKLVSQLKDNGVTLLDTIATYEYGKFIHIMDQEGNKIELWEPTESKDSK